MNTSPVVDIEFFTSPPGKVHILFEDGAIKEVETFLGPGYWVRIRKGLLAQEYDPPYGSFAREVVDITG